MSTFSSTRAASNVEKMPTAYPNSDRPRLSPSLNAEKSQTHGGYGVNAADRPPRNRSPFKQSVAGQSAVVTHREHAKFHVRDEGRTSGSAARGLGADAARVPWNPQASLVSPTSAPLASRISIPPLSSLVPKELQPQPLAELSLKDQEDAIVEDLLYVFMGFEGQYIRFVDSYNPLEEKERLIGPNFKILHGLDPSLRDLAYSVLRSATHYIALDAFVEVQSREEFGLVNHALCAAIRTFLKDYLVLIAQLEHQLLTNDEFTLHVLTLHIKPMSYTLSHLYNVTHEILKRNAILEEDPEDDDKMDDIDRILDELRENNDPGGLTVRKVCKGGTVLGLITKRLATMAGDPAARTLLTTLLSEASRPYMRMLNEWLHHGGIKDPHGEFLIKEQKSIRREGLEQDYTDEYWEKRYTIREGDIPPQLEGVKEKVLLAGKYLNVVRECGGIDISKEVRDVPASFDEPHFLDNVNGAYAYANSSLLKLLLTTHGLPARLRSLKHYFFLDRSDFFSSFLELSTSELKKSAKLVNIGKLQSLLDIVLRQPGSVAAEDPFKEDVKVSIIEIGLTNWLMRVVNVTGLDQDAAYASTNTLLTPAAPPSVVEDKDITGFDALVFDYAVPFPLSLVISRVTLTRYQLLFRWLLSLRHIETLLTGSWIEQSKGQSWLHRSSNQKIEAWKRKAWTLRARMLCFVQQMLYFCTAEVIEPNWQALMSRLSERQEGNDSPIVKRTVDELMQDHVDFLATSLKECMLTNSKLLRINSKITQTCSLFAGYTSSLSRSLAAADADLAPSDPSKAAQPSSSVAAAHDPARLDKIADILQKYEYNFTKHLRILIDALDYLAATETATFLNLSARLSTAAEGMGEERAGGYG